MAWLKLDDRVRTHPKIVQAGPAAAWFWLCGVCYCREHLTDGLIMDAMLPTLAPGLAGWKRCAASLVSAGLWHRVENGYRVHDFLDWNPTRAEVEAQRASDRARKGIGNRRDSEQIPDGKVMDSDATRDAHTGSGSASSTSIGSGSLEKVQGEPLKAKPIRFVSPAEWHRQHGKHVGGFCDWLCLPESVVDGFVRRLMGAGTDEGVARAQTLAWAKGVRQAWAGRVPGDDIFAFWRNEWAATHGSNKPALSTAAVDPLAGVKEALRRG